MVGGLGMVHCSYVGMITNQFMRKTWVLQHIHIRTCTHTYCKISG